MIKYIYKVWDKKSQYYVGSSRRSTWTKFPTQALDYMGSLENCEVHQFEVNPNPKAIGLDKLGKRIS